MRRSHLAISMGDPSGIGPEIVFKAVSALGDPLARGDLRLTIVGEESAFAAAARSIGLQDWRGLFKGPSVDFVPCGNARAPHEFGKVSEDCGRLAFLAIEKAVDLVMHGEADGVVTAPLNKEALNKAGYHFNGHTEILASLTGAPDSFMMLAHGDLRVTHFTTHVPLAKVPSLVTTDRVTRTVEVTLDMLKSEPLRVYRRLFSSFYATNSN